MADDVDLTPDNLDQLVTAITTAFRNPADAHQLLRRIELPAEHWPNFAVDHAYAWDQVFQKLNSGAVEQPYRRLITQAVRRFGAHPVFSRLAARVEGIRHVMVVGASPDGAERVRGDREVKLIMASGLRVTPVLAASIADLSAVSRLHPDALHLTCHGDGTNLIFETADGQVEPVAATAVVELLAAHVSGTRLRAVVLNACFSADVAPLFAAVAEVVIAHAGELDDDCAATFAGALYAQLSAGASIPQAADRAATSAATSPYCADLRRDMVVLTGG